MEGEGVWKVSVEGEGVWKVSVWKVRVCGR